MKKGFWTLILGLSLGQLLSTGCGNNSPTSPAATSTPVPVPTNWAGYTSTPSFTPTSTGSSTATPTGSATPTFTNTFPAGTGTPTFTPTLTNTFTNTFTFTGSATPTITPTFTISFTPTISFTGTNTPTNTLTFTNTFPAGTNTPTVTLTFTSTNSATPTVTATNTFVATPAKTLFGSSIIYPNGVAVGNSKVYVAQDNGIVQVFTTAGASSAQWTSFGSTAFVEPYGVAVDPTTGNVYVLDRSKATVYGYTSAGATIVSWSSWTGGTVTSFSVPEGIAVDNVGNIYVADTGNNTVEQFTVSGSTVNYLNQWNTGTTGFNYPSAVAATVVSGPTTLLYVADSVNELVQAFSNGTYSTSWSIPGSDLYGLTLDGSGNVYTADVGNSLVEEYSSTGTFINSWNGSAGTSYPSFSSPDGLAWLDSTHLLVADFDNGPSASGSVMEFGP